MIYDSNDIPASAVTVSDNPAPKQNISDLADLKYSSISVKTPKSTLYNFVAIDIETTGLSASKNEIIEVSAVRFRNGRAVEKFLTFTYPKRGIQPDALSVNRITESMVSGSPIFPCIAASLEDFIGNDNIVGHNLEFDLKFLYKYGVNFLKQKRRYYDTLKIAPKVLKRPKKKWDQDLESYEIDYESDYDVDDYKLSTLCDYYNINMLDSHRAADDCYATGLLFIQFGAEYGAIADPLEKAKRTAPAPRSSEQGSSLVQCPFNYTSKDMVRAEAMSSYVTRFEFNFGLTEKDCSKLFSFVERAVSPDVEVVSAFIAKKNGTPCACAMAISKLIIADDWKTRTIQTLDISGFTYENGTLTVKNKADDIILSVSAQRGQAICDVCNQSLIACKKEIESNSKANV